MLPATRGQIGDIRQFGTVYVADTAEKLVGIIESQGTTLFARIDQRAAAKTVGLMQRYPWNRTMSRRSL